MKRYLNKSLTSGVIAYEIHSNGIDVLFKDWALYKYSTCKNSIKIIEYLKSYALNGIGLNGALTKKDIYGDYIVKYDFKTKVSPASVKITD